MCRRFMPRLWLLATVILGFSTTAASTPAACTGAHCVYLPLVSTPGLVKLSNVRLGRANQYDEYHIMSGNVQLTTSTPVYSVTLEVRSYDEQGNVATKYTGQPLFPATLPGQLNPFYFEAGFSTNFEDIPHYDIRVKSLSRTHPRTLRAPSLDITAEICDSTTLRIEGTITNAYEEPLEDVRGILWVFQNTYGYGPQLYAPRLEPFQTVPFTASVAYEACGVFGPPIYNLTVQGVEP